MTGCKTNTTTELVFPPEPKRQTVNIPETVKDYAALIIYYEGLVREWELWAETTKTLLETETSTP